MATGCFEEVLRTGLGGSCRGGKVDPPDEEGVVVSGPAAVCPGGQGWSASLRVHNSMKRVTSASSLGFLPRRMLANSGKMVHTVFQAAHNTSPSSAAEEEEEEEVLTLTQPHCSVLVDTTAAAACWRGTAAAVGVGGTAAGATGFAAEAPATQPKTTPQRPRRQTLLLLQPPQNYRTPADWRPARGCAAAEWRPR